MKKYVKPELFYEQYELSQHIASCAWELTNSSKESCSAQPDPGLLPGLPNLFIDATNSCAITPDVIQDYCYHDGVGGSNVFAS